MLLMQCFYLLLKVESLFKTRKNAAKWSSSSEKFKHFLTRGLPPLDAFGVLMSLPKTNPP